MKMNFKVLVAAMGVLGLSMQAEALTITPSEALCDADPVCLLDWGPENSNPDVLAAVQALIGPTVLGYKAGPNEEEGPGAPFYESTFSSDGEGALIEWGGGAFFQASPLYMIVKDGKNDPGYYLFKLTGWDGQEDLVLDDFWPDQGGISHVELRGKVGADQFCTVPGGCESVPDGGSTTMLLGMGLLGLAALRRRLGRI